MSLEKKRFISGFLLNRRAPQSAAVHALPQLFSSYASKDAEGEVSTKRSLESPPRACGEATDGGVVLLRRNAFLIAGKASYSSHEINTLLEDTLVDRGYDAGKQGKVGKDLLRVEGGKRKSRRKTAVFLGGSDGETMMRKPLHAETWDCASLFLMDIAGFTSISATLSSEKIADMLRRFFRRVDIGLGIFGMELLDIIGDAYMAKNISEAHHEKTIRFALFCINAADKTLIDPENPNVGTIEVRTAVHCGALHGIVLRASPFRHTLVGPAIGIIKYLECAGKPGYVHCSSSVIEHINEHDKDSNSVQSTMDRGAAENATATAMDGRMAAAKACTKRGKEAQEAESTMGWMLTRMTGMLTTHKKDAIVKNEEGGRQAEGAEAKGKGKFNYNAFYYHKHRDDLSLCEQSAGRDRSISCCSLHSNANSLSSVSSLCSDGTDLSLGSRSPSSLSWCSDASLRGSMCSLEEEKNEDGHEDDDNDDGTGEERRNKGAGLSVALASLSAFAQRRAKRDQKMMIRLLGPKMRIRKMKLCIRPFKRLMLDADGASEMYSEEVARHDGTLTFLMRENCTVSLSGQVVMCALTWRFLCISERFGSAFGFACIDELRTFKMLCGPLTDMSVCANAIREVQANREETRRVRVTLYCREGKCMENVRIKIGHAPAGTNVTLELLVK